MKNTVREMIKNVIEENAVSFKETTSRVLLNKVGNVLSEKYVEISQKLFEDFDDRAPDVQRIPGQPNGQTAVATDPAYMGSLYDPTNVFWSTDAGRAFMQGWDYLVANYTNQSAWNRPGFPPFMSSPQAFLAYLRQRASENGTQAPPWPPLKEENEMYGGPPRPVPGQSTAEPVSLNKDAASSQYSQYEPGYNQKNSEYNPNNPFWNTSDGQAWRQNWERLQAAMRNPNNLTRSMTEYLEQNNFENLEAFKQYLLQQAAHNHVVPPRLAL
jgi:hypothetical protein